MPRYASIIQQQHMYLKLKAAKLHFSMNRSPFSLKWGFSLTAKKEAHWKKGTLLKVHFVALSFKHLDTTTDANGSSLVFFLSSSAWDFVAWKARGCFLSLLPKAKHFTLFCQSKYLEATREAKQKWEHPSQRMELSLPTHYVRWSGLQKNTPFTSFKIPSFVFCSILFEHCSLLNRKEVVLLHKIPF